MTTVAQYPIRVLVCGSRTWNRPDEVDRILDKIHAEQGIGSVVAGEAKGPDLFAAAWAERRAVTYYPFPADWKKYGRRAGFLRNKQMLDEMCPDLVVAFMADPPTKGTAMMVKLAEQAGTEVLVVG